VCNTVKNTPPLKDAYTHSPRQTRAAVTHTDSCCFPVRSGSSCVPQRPHGFVTETKPASMLPTLALAAGLAQSSESSRTAPGSYLPQAGSIFTPVNAAASEDKFGNSDSLFQLVCTEKFLFLSPLPTAQALCAHRGPPPPRPRAPPAPGKAQRPRPEPPRQSERAAPRVWARKRTECEELERPPRPALRRSPGFRVSLAAGGSGAPGGDPAPSPGGSGNPGGARGPPG